MQIIDFNSKSYNIVYVLSKTNSSNIDLIKHKYNADTAFANNTDIYFGQEITDVIGEEIIFNELSLEELISSIFSLNCSNIPIELLINKIKFHSPNNSIKEINQEIIKYLNTHEI